MITLTYTTPSEGATHLSGTWTDGAESGDFMLKIVYTGGVMDLPATETKMKNTIQQDLDLQEVS
jgi:hypothetical protein